MNRSNILFERKITTFEMFQMSLTNKAAEWIAYIIYFTHTYFSIFVKLVYFKVKL